MTPLHLNRPLCFRDFANHAALLIWHELLHEKDAPRPDPHSFPLVAQALHRVFLHHVCVDAFCVSTRGDRSSSPSAPWPSASRCQAHKERLLLECGPQLRALRSEAHKAVVDALSRESTTRARYHGFQDKVRHAMLAMDPYLYENVACSHCEQQADGSLVSGL